MSLAVGVLIWVSIAAASMVVVSYLATRWGRDAFGWVVLAGALGPLAVVGLVGTRQADRARTPVTEFSGKRTGTVIVVACDGSQGSLAAAQHVAKSGIVDAQVVLLTVLPHEARPRRVATHQDQHREHVRRLIEASQELLRTAGIASDVAVTYGRPAEEIVRFAEDHDVMEVVMGRRGAGLAKTILGSVSEEVLRTTDRPVTVVS